MQAELGLGHPSNAPGDGPTRILRWSEIWSRDVGDGSPLGADGPSHIAVPGPAAVLAIALFAASAGAGVLYLDWPFPSEDRAFTATGQYFLWISILCAQAALWAVAIFPIAASLRVLWRFGENSWGRVILATCSIGVAWVLIAVASALARTSLRYEVRFPYVGAKLAVFVGVGGAVAISALLGMVLVHRGLTRLARTVGSEVDRDTFINDLLLLREHLQRLLAIEGAIIGAAVLAYAALRNAVLAASPEQAFPPELVLIYGGAFSIALALVWAPIYGIFVAVGTRLSEGVIGERAEDESWADWRQRRKTFDDAIDLHASATASFRSALAILTPLGSALLGLLFNT
jgi:hypothetical protein